jgi:hypothetical protein
MQPLHIFRISDAWGILTVEPVPHAALDLDVRHRFHLQIPLLRILRKVTTVRSLKVPRKSGMSFDEI